MITTSATSQIEKNLYGARVGNIIKLINLRLLYNYSSLFLTFFKVKLHMTFKDLFNYQSTFHKSRAFSTFMKVLVIE
jgi:hypothetical protein